MKKHFIVLSAVLFALVACNKETPIVEGGPIDASKLVFNVTVNHPGDTKAVKSNWVAGDKIYLFFENNTTAYVTLTSDDGSNRNWTPAISGELDLEHEGEHVTAVYLPFNTDTPTYDGGWKFETKYAYYLKAEGVEYTVTTDPSTEISTLDVKLSMVAPAGFVQFFLPDASPVANKYVLIEDHVIPAGCGKITPGGVVEQVTRQRSSQMMVFDEFSYPDTAEDAQNKYTLTNVASTSGYPMEAMIITGEGGGYYFYGTLASGVSDPTFYLVEQDPDYLFAIGTQTKTYSGKTLSAGAAIKFGSFGTQEKWVDLGLPRGVKWATGNLSNTGMVGPKENGYYFQWGATVGYSPDAEGKVAGCRWDDYPFFTRYATAEEAAAAHPTKPAVDYEYDAWVNKYTYGFQHTLEPGTPRVIKPGDGLTRLEASDDAAIQILGGKWRMGTCREWTELIENCSSLPNYRPTTGGPHTHIKNETIKGHILRRNGLALFLPAAGYAVHKTTQEDDPAKATLSGEGDNCFYWNSDVYFNASYMQGTISRLQIDHTNPEQALFKGSFRKQACPIRAVYIP